MKKIKLIIVDDHQIVRDGLKLLLKLSENIDVVGEAHDASSLFANLKKVTPDILLLDIELPGKSGIEIAKEITKDFPSIKIIILSAQTSESNVISAIETGVHGFLPKHSGQNQLLQAIHTVNSGEEYFDASISQIVIKSIKQSFSEKTARSTLTPRESEIVKLISEGLLHKEIALQLFISKRTVDNHVSNIMQKLSFRSKADIIRYAFKSGLVH